MSDSSTSSDDDLIEILGSRSIKPTNAKAAQLPPASKSQRVITQTIAEQQVAVPGNGVGLSGRIQRNDPVGLRRALPNPNDEFRAPHNPHVRLRHPPWISDNGMRGFGNPPGSLRQASINPLDEVEFPPLLGQAPPFRLPGRAPQVTTQAIARQQADLYHFGGEPRDRRQRKQLGGLGEPSLNDSSEYGQLLDRRFENQPSQGSSFQFYDEGQRLRREFGTATVGQRKEPQREFHDEGGQLRKKYENVPQEIGQAPPVQPPARAPRHSTTQTTSGQQVNMCDGNANTNMTQPPRRKRGRPPKSTKATLTSSAPPPSGKLAPGPRPSNALSNQRIPTSQSKEPMQTVPVSQPVQQSFLFEEPFSRKMFFDRDAGVYRIDRAPIDNMPMNSIVAYIAGKNWNARDIGKTCVVAFFAEHSGHNKGLLLAGGVHANFCPMAPVAHAAKFALDTILNMMKNEKRFELITHIVLCTNSRSFLLVMDCWKWIFQNTMWTATRTVHAPVVYTDHYQLSSLLCKLVDLRQKHIQVSFHGMDAREMTGAYEMIRELNRKA
jgi:hypothetical protein